RELEVLAGEEARAPAGICEPERGDVTEAGDLERLAVRRDARPGHVLLDDLDLERREGFVEHLAPEPREGLERARAGEPADEAAEGLAELTCTSSEDPLPDPLPDGEVEPADDRHGGERGRDAGERERDEQERVDEHHGEAAEEPRERAEPPALDVEEAVARE